MLNYLALAVIAIVGCCYEASLLFGPTSALRAAATSPFPIDEFARGERIGQTIRSPADGFSAVDIQIDSSRAADVNVRWRLLGWAPMKADDHWAVIYEFPATLHLPSGRSWQHFAFPPLIPSEKLIYQFEIERARPRSEEANAVRPTVALVGSADGPRTDGNLIVGGVQVVDRDLVYVAYTASRYERFRIRTTSILPRPLRLVAVQLALLFGYNVAMLIFGYELMICAPKGLRT